ncbi:MAG: putative metal-dependent hydrolase [Gammaproteobacteria bacterium]|jgi:kynurenine formamidase|nr:putative metal-dependent hydrolase [Gammaproteobacteria bacterium]
MRLIDLSLEIAPNNSEPVPVEIEYISHEEGADILGKPININHEQFPDGMGLSLEHIKLTTHTGTHIDAPLHYGPLCEGKEAKNISELPLNWFFQNGVVLNCHDDTNRGAITQTELQKKLEEIGYQIQPLDIVLLNTGADKWWGKAEYFTHFRGVTKEATAWLVEQGVKIIGIDSFGFDPPFHEMLKNYKDTQNISSLWPAHFYGREKEYCQIERLANLSLIPKSFGFKVCCFPIKIQKCGASWSRVVAIIED